MKLLWFLWQLVLMTLMRTVLFCLGLWSTLKFGPSYMCWARASMKGRTEHKESIWLWTIIVHSHLKEWLLLVLAAFCNPEDNPRLGWEGGELQCTSFCPFVEIDWAKDKISICNRSYMEAESALAELSKAGCNSLHCWGTAVSLLVWVLTHVI